MNCGDTVQPIKTGFFDLLTQAKGLGRDPMLMRFGTCLPSQSVPVFRVWSAWKAAQRALGGAGFASVLRLQVRP